MEEFQFFIFLFFNVIAYLEFSSFNRIPCLLRMQTGMIFTIHEYQLQQSKYRMSSMIFQTGEVIINQNINCTNRDLINRCLRTILKELGFLNLLKINVTVPNETESRDQIKCVSIN